MSCIILYSWLYVNFLVLCTIKDVHIHINNIFSFINIIIIIIIIIVNYIIIIL